jgi:hypothetical protein
MNSLIPELSILNEKVKDCYTDLGDVLQNLQQFENNYNMPSQEFFKKFSRGELAHETDFFEWYAFYDISKKLLNKIRDLEKELSETLEEKLSAAD